MRPLGGIGAKATTDTRLWATAGSHREYCYQVPLVARGKVIYQRVLWSGKINNALDRAGSTFCLPSARCLPLASCSRPNRSIRSVPRQLLPVRPLTSGTLTNNIHTV